MIFTISFSRQVSWDSLLFRKSKPSCTEKFHSSSVRLCDRVWIYSPLNCLWLDTVCRSAVISTRHSSRSLSSMKRKKEMILITTAWVCVFGGHYHVAGFHIWDLTVVKSVWFTSNLNTASVTCITFMHVLRNFRILISFFLQMCV